MRIIYLLFSIFSFSIVSAQTSYDKNYFRYPLDIPKKLNANFGEMRNNHFHMGLDLNTISKENWPLYAAAEGYIAKIKIESGGFGNAIYINHPNGLTTLYAHLNSYTPEVAAYIKQQQYKAESWKIELNIPANVFPVKKGQLIGYSGNTGASAGPHVHFEIRETVSEKCLNPQLFDFGITDNIPPTIYKIAIYDANKSLYEQTPRLIAVKKLAANKYTIAKTIKVNTDKILVAVQATDRNSLSMNPNGFYSATLYKNDVKTSEFILDKISYDETRFENGHIDFKTKFNGGAYLQLLNALPGFTNDIYKDLPGKDLVTINDYDVKNFKLEVKDANGNASVLEFKLQSENVSPAVTSNPINRITPNIINIKEGTGWQMYFPENCFYDVFDFKMTTTTSSSPQAYSPVFLPGPAYVPVHDTFYIRIRPNKEIPATLKDRLVIQKEVKKKKDVQKVTWQRDMAQAEFKEFGSFILLADQVPPQIAAWGLKDSMNVSSMKKIVITVKDNLEEVKNFRAELDGKWLLFSQRGNTFTYWMDEHFTPGEHLLKISVQDEAGNTSEHIYKLTK